MTFKQRLGKWLFAHLPITRFLFDQLRFELNSFLVWLMNWCWPPQRRKLARIRGASGLRVNVACGPHIEPGFINLDLFAASPEVIRWDCRRKLPLRDASAVGIRIEQFLEHLEVREELPTLLADCLRVLKPGGILRVIVPDGRRYIEAYLQPDLSAFKKLVWPSFSEELPARMDVVSFVFHQYHEHRWAYDFENLVHRLKAAGFAQVKQMSYRCSNDPMLACDLQVHAPYSLYVEAFKPREPNKSSGPYLQMTVDAVEMVIGK
jgi:predicted SAM-dependent methyltransferase